MLEVLEIFLGDFFASTMFNIIAVLFISFFITSSIFNGFVTNKIYYPLRGFILGSKSKDVKSIDPYSKKNSVLNRKDYNSTETENNRTNRKKLTKKDSKTKEFDE